VEKVRRRRGRGRGREERSRRRGRFYLHLGPVGRIAEHVNIQELHLCEKEKVSMRRRIRRRRMRRGRRRRRRKWKPLLENSDKRVCCSIYYRGSKRGKTK